jgi:hypothetical protein
MNRNPLRQYFLGNQGRMIHKWDHYFDIYHRHLQGFRGRPITLVEIGVYHGGSLEMWRSYLGRRARIIGIDFDERVATLADGTAEIVIGDQSDRLFLANLRDRLGSIDIVIDDGGHTMEEQLVSFDELWPTIAAGGVYIVEDLHTSYWPEFGGALRDSGSFIEFAKTIIDLQNAWHVRNEELPVNDLTRSVRGLHAYDSVIVFDKDVVERPWAIRTGNPSFPLGEFGRGT